MRASRLRSRQPAITRLASPGLSDIMDVGRRRDQCMHQARVGIHPNVGLHAKVPLPGQMIVDGLEDHPSRTTIRSGGSLAIPALIMTPRPSRSSTLFF